VTFGTCELVKSPAVHSFVASEMNRLESVQVIPARCLEAAIIQVVNLQRVARFVSFYPASLTLIAVALKCFEAIFVPCGAGVIGVQHALKICGGHAHRHLRSHDV
jgi:hypothetical protein